MSDRSLARRRKKTTRKRWVAACAAAAVAIAIPALAAPSASAGGQDETHKVWVCKYVGKPGVDEQLKSGKQPISVDESATDGTGVGGFFNDAQGRSYVVAIDDGSGSPGASACPAPDGGPEVVEDASASVSTVPATCGSGEVLVYGKAVNASFSGTEDGAEGPGSYNVTATADAGHAFVGGDTTDGFSGSLDGPLTGAQCAGPQPSDDTEYRDVEDAPDCSAGTVAIQHQERTRSYTLDGDTWVPGAWTTWSTISTSSRPATAEECPSPTPVTKVAIPDQPATADPCNGAGVSNNVTWAGSLPASNAEVTWSEDPDTHVRTATLVGDAEWTDGTIAPQVFFLPGDDGRPCDTPLIPVTALSGTWADPCGTADDTYVIPSVEGVIYTVNGVVTGPGTYPGSGTVSIAATAAGGYTLTNPWLAFDMVFTDEPCVDSVGTVTAVTTCSGVTFTASGFEPLYTNENGYIWAFEVKLNGVSMKPDGFWSAQIPKGEGSVEFSLSSPDQSTVQNWTVDVYEWQPWTEAGDVLVASFGPFVQPACATPPVKVDIPPMPGVNDPCNPVGVGNNVTWKGPLPADTDHVKWVEDSLARTASLVGDAVEWTDGTTVPKVYRLPGDSGEVCVVTTTTTATSPPATTPVTTTATATATTTAVTSPAASTPVTTTAASQPPVATTNQPAAVNPPPADQGAPPAAAAPVAAAAPADAGSSQSDQASSAVSAGAPPPPEAGDVAAAAPSVHKSADAGLVRALAILAGVVLTMLGACWLAPRFGGRR